MTTITLRSPHPDALEELVSGALANETRLLQAAIERTQAQLAAFEARYGMATADFLQRYGQDQVEETLDMIDWVGEARLLQRLRQKLTVLQDIRIENSP
jgi:phage shock protein A